MNEFLSRKDRRSERSSGGGIPRLRVGLFGKHPAWDDHVRGIGPETEFIADVRNTLYDQGIRGQIDNGAWEKLTAEKRLPGFDHVLLFIRENDLVLATLSSSRDGKGRGEYPLVVCVHALGITPAQAIRSLLPELQRLQSACHQGQSTTRVTDECESTQQRFDQIAATLSRDVSQAEVGAQEKAAFLQSPELGPERIGLLRIVYEIENARNALAQRSAGKVAGLFHTRAPTTGAAPPYALAIWAEFLRAALPETVPILLIARQGTNWIDFIMGEPSTEDLFCLQAAPGALPLASEIPYELPPELAARLSHIEKRFLASPRAEPGTALIAPTGKPAPSSHPKRQPGGSRDKKFLRRGFFGGMVAAIVLMAAAGIYTLRQPTDVSIARAPAVQRAETTRASSDEGYNAALVRARNSLRDQDFTNALASVDAALALRPNRAEALTLKGEIKAQIDKWTESEQVRKFEFLLGAAKKAYESGDFSYSVAHAASALAVKPGDPPATQLKQDAEWKVASRQRRQLLLAAAGRDLDEMRAESALSNAVLALSLDPSDPQATAFRDRARAEIERQRVVSQTLQAYENAMAARNHPLAQAEAGKISNLDPNHPRLSKISTQLVLLKNYSEAMAHATNAIARKEFGEANAFVQKARQIFTNEPAVTNLVQQINEKQREDRFERALIAAKEKYRQKEWAAAAEQVKGALREKADDPAATALAQDIEREAREAQIDTNYKNEMTAAADLFRKGDFTNAKARAELALDYKTNDASARELVQKADRELAAKSSAVAVRAVASNSPVRVTPLPDRTPVASASRSKSPANSPPVPASEVVASKKESPKEGNAGNVAVTADAAASNRAKRLEDDLYVSEVYLGLRPNDEKKMHRGRLAEKVKGAAKNKSFTESVLKLERDFKDADLLDATRQERFSKIKDAIRDAK